jgi:hypothetical protein
MDNENLEFYRDLISRRDAALNIAHRALRDGASKDEKYLARVAIASLLPELQN